MLIFVYRENMHSVDFFFPMTKSYYKIKQIHKHAHSIKCKVRIELRFILPRKKNMRKKSVTGLVNGNEHTSLVNARNETNLENYNNIHMKEIHFCCCCYLPGDSKNDASNRVRECLCVGVLLLCRNGNSIFELFAGTDEISTHELNNTSHETSVFRIPVDGQGVWHSSGLFITLRNGE